MKRHSYSEDEEPVVKKVTQRKNFRTVPGTAPDETEEKASKKGIGVGEHDDCLTSKKGPDQDTKPAERQGTNDTVRKDDDSVPSNISTDKTM